MAEEKYRTPRKGGSIGVGTRKELEEEWREKKKLLLRAQTDVAFWSEELRKPGLTPEREEVITAHRQAAREQQAELKEEVQKLEAQIEQLSAPHMGESACLPGIACGLPFTHRLFVSQIPVVCAQSRLPPNKREEDLESCWMP